LRRSYFILVIAIAACAAAYGVFLDYGWVTAWSANIGAGLLTSLVIIFLIDRALERRREQEQRRVSRVALAQLRAPLMRHLFLLRDWYQAVLVAPPADQAKTIDELFDEAYVSEIRFLNMSAAAPIIPPRDWLQRSGEEFDDFKRESEAIVDRYAVFLDAWFIELLQGAAASKLSHMLILMTKLPVRQVQQQFGVSGPVILFQHESVAEIIREHLGLVLGLVKYFNSNYQEPIEIGALAFNEGAGPKFGSARLTV
jgi:hypothetical protein